MVMLSGALEDLDQEVRTQIAKGEAFNAQGLDSYRAARSELRRFCISAIAAGVDSAYALMLRRLRCRRWGYLALQKQTAGCQRWKWLTNVSLD